MKDLIIRSGIGGDDVNVVNSDDAKSVFSLLPEAAQNYVKDIPEGVWNLSLGELVREAKPSLELRKLRIAFWLEYERAVRTEMPMNMTSICKGLMGVQTLYKSVLAKPHAAVYLMTPPEDYRVQMEEMLQLALEEERKILELPAVKKTTYVNKNGDPIVSEVVDTGVASIKHKIRESLQNRLHGMPVQRTHNVNKNVESKDGGEKRLEDMGEDELQKYVAELEKRKSGPPIDITPESGES
jgi:hypothetical protein